MKNQRRTGIVISYFNFAVSILGNLLLTPALIRLLGNEQYSLYQVMRSFGGTLLMFNLGVSSIVARSIARCRVLEEHEKQHTLAIGLLLSCGLALLVAAVSAVVHACIPLFYRMQYEPLQLQMAQAMFRLFAAASICHILTDAFAGCLIGHEHFAANALIVTFKYALRFGLMFLLIRKGADAAAIAQVDLVVGACALACLAGYALLVLRERPKLTRPASGELRRLFVFSAAVLMQEAVSQLNSHMDPILLGRLTDAATVVTLYSSALTIYNLYHQLVSMIGGYYLARASRLVARHASGAELTDMIIRPGQFQAAIAVGAIAGFAMFGRSFIVLWIGAEYAGAYGVVLAMMIPALIPLVQTSALSILDAQFKRMYRSAALLGCTALNVLLSVLLIRWIGYPGAAIGTAVSVLVGHGWLMNRFYAREIGLDIPRMFRSIFRPVLLPAALSCLFCLPLTYLPQTWFAFAVQCTVFAAAYALLLFTHNRKKG